MWRAICWLACLTVLQVDPAFAGPWSRDEGGVFAAMSFERDRQGDGYDSLYAEYGLPDRKTVGLEIGHASQGEISALVWFQKSMDDPEGATRLSVSMGAGALRRDGELLPIGTVGVAYGRGFQRFGGGWLAVEARLKAVGEMTTVAHQDGTAKVETDYLTPEFSAKLDTTVGFNLRPTTALVNQLLLEARQDEDVSAKLAFSVVQEVAGPAKLQVGVIAPVAGSGEPALKIGTWVEF